MQFNVEKLKEMASAHVDARGWVEIIVFCGMAVFIWVKSVPNAQPVNTWHAATPAKEVQTVEKQVIVPKYIVVYKDSAKQAMELPADVKADPDIHVLEATQLVANDHPQQVVCTQNAANGESDILIRAQPLPWLASENKGEVRLSYGFTNAGLRARLSANEDLLAIKALHFGVNGSIDGSGNTFAGVGVGYKW